MFYPIAIEPGDDKHAWGVVVPDIEGCFSAGESLDDAVAKAKEAIEGHLEAVAEDGGDVPLAGTLDEHRNNPEFAGWVWALVEIDVNRFLGGAEKINITVPRILLKKIDDAVKTDPRFQSRSGLLADGALRILSERAHKAA